MNTAALFFSPNFHSLYKPTNPLDFPLGTKHPLFRPNSGSGSTIGSMFFEFRCGIQAGEGAGKYTQMLEKCRSRYGNW
ncbi:hypothetical protein SLA2020_253500 [Shorea laevis]